MQIPEIKPRLVAAVDARNDYDDVVYSRGSLNPVKALAIWDDVIEIWDMGSKTRRMLVGSVRNKNAIFQLVDNLFDYLNSESWHFRRMLNRMHLEKPLTSGEQVPTQTCQRSWTGNRYACFRVTRLNRL